MPAALNDSRLGWASPAKRSRPACKPGKSTAAVKDKPNPAVNAHILLVEDHAPTRVALTQLLLRRRFKVSSAASLAEARSLLGQGLGSIDLLISDIGLPDGNGCDLMQELGREKKLKGIALTGFGGEQDISRTRDAGFAMHLTKPVNIEVLDKALAAILG